MATQVDAISALLTGLGGTKTTSNAGDTDALQSVMAQLQGSNNYEQLLQSIFQKAAGQIPGIQAATTNAVGARSGRNSATQAALAQLLKDTTIAGTQAVTTAQQNNLNTQAQVSGSVAQATKGTQQQSGANVGNAAKNLAVLKLLSESGVLKKGGLSGWFGDSGDSAQAAPMDMTGFSTPEAPTVYTPSADASTGTPFQSIDFGFNQDFTDPAAGLLDFSGGALEPEFNLDDFGGGPQMPVEEIYVPTEADLTDYGQYYADGGLVGNANPATEDAAEDAAQQRFEPGHTTNRVLDILQTIIKQDGKMQASNFADGGLVTQRAAGGRRSSAPQVQTTAPTQAAANNVMPVPVQVPTLAPANPTPQLTADATMALGGNGSSRGTGPGMNENMPSQLSPAVRSGINAVTGVNNVLGATGLGGIRGLGTIGSLAKARDPKEALGAVGMGALGMVAPQAKSLVSLAMNPTTANAIDVGVSLNPVGAIGNAILGLGDSSIGTFATNLYDTMNPNQMMTPDQQALVAEEKQFGFSSGRGGGGYGFGSESARSGMNAGDARGVGGESSGTMNAADGGEIPGEGSGIADNQQINVSPGEFVVSKDVVDAIGVDFFEALQQALHTPAAIQRARS